MKPINGIYDERMKIRDIYVNKKKISQLFKLISGFMEENIMNDFKPPKFIKFPSDLRGIRYKNGKEEIKILCSDGEYHWIDYSRYKNR